MIHPDWELLFGTALLVGIILVALAAINWSAYEIWAVWTNHEPITGFVRGSLNGKPWLATVMTGVVAFAVGILLGHFDWHN